jgi:hypothetical protein
LQRAAELPWTDDGRCAVREASQPWPVLVERCFQVLDRDRLRLKDPSRRCAVAQAEEAIVIGFCVVTAPEVAAGAMIVLGVVVAVVAIKEALDEYEVKRGRIESTRMPATSPIPPDLLAERWPKPEPRGPDFPPPPPRDPPDRDRPKCEAIPVPHRGGDAIHNMCADVVPPNRYPGKDVCVAGKCYDSLQAGAPVLWEIKTDQFDTYSDFLRKQVIDDQFKELIKERDIAEACGYRFVIGVSSAAHKAALLARNDRFVIVVTGCPQ